MDFAEQYILLREKEFRLYSDEELRLLPNVNATHPHYREWRMRSESSRRLIDYLVNKQSPMDILEAGCGNGWLCSQIAKAITGNVTGLDINKPELEQAKRVFTEQKNLAFITGGLESLQQKKFHVIIFAASIQYFSSLHTTLTAAFKILHPKGEVHILDSHFYKLSELPGAQRRTEAYYSKMGFPGLAPFYFHHSFEELKLFKHKFLYKPNSVFTVFNKNKNPFPWICIYP